MGRENANERDQVVIIASLGPLECPVKTVEINFTNSGFFLPTHEFWHSPRTYVHEAERPAAAVCLVSYWNNLESRMPVI